MNASQVLSDTVIVHYIWLHLQSKYANKWEDLIQIECFVIFMINLHHKSEKCVQLFNLPSYNIYAEQSMGRYAHCIHHTSCLNVFTTQNQSPKHFSTDFQFENICNQPISADVERVVDCLA